MQANQIPLVKETNPLLLEMIIWFIVKKIDTKATSVNSSALSMATTAVRLRFSSKYHA